MKTLEEIRQLSASVGEAVFSPTLFAGTSFEEGIDAALRWVMGEMDEEEIIDFMKACKR